MAYDSRAIANWFFYHAKERRETVCPMKMQKLVYYAHGWHLGLFDEALINEQVECWPYGPVIDTLFHQFKKYGRDPIAQPAEKFEFKEDGEPFDFAVHEPTIWDEAQTADETDGYLEVIWKHYGKYDAIKLSNMTHTPGGPWHQVYTEHNGDPPKGTDIPQAYIRDYFKSKG